ncbi:MAG: ornithine carbamoyltransferase, partial [Alphaproteobacteria bacterium]|nr:ornithine carbamoyltransferase [Alphaproteobacteria bacterium]
MNAPAGRVRTVKHFLDLTDFDGGQLNALIADARKRKDARKGLPNGTPDADAPLPGRMLAIIFDKPSTRTRISFDVGMQQLGGKTIMLTGAEMQLGRGETMADTARVLSRYVDGIMIRTLDQDMLHELADNASIPVINGMTKLSHPCQVLADVMTFEEKLGPIKGRTVAWTGDSNNVQASWVHAAAKFGFELRVATPKELAPRESLRQW